MSFNPPYFSGQCTLPAYTHTHTHTHSSKSCCPDPGFLYHQLPHTLLLFVLLIQPSFGQECTQLEHSLPQISMYLEMTQAPGLANEVSTEVNKVGFQENYRCPHNNGQNQQAHAFFFSFFFFLFLFEMQKQCLEVPSHFATVKVSHMLRKSKQEARSLSP